MRVSNINSTQPSSKGYLHKSVYKYINTATTNAKNDLRGIESKVSKQQFKAVITQIEQTKKSVIANLESFIKKCHPKTYFVIEERSGYNMSMNLNNKNLKLNYSVPGASLLRIGGVLKDTEVLSPMRERTPQLFGEFSTRLGDNDLRQIKKYSDELIKVDSRCADKAILRNYENQSVDEEKTFLGRFSRKKHHKKIENFAREIGA